MDTEKSVPHLKAADIFTIGDGASASDIADIDAYLSVFGPFKNEAGDHACLNCGKKVDSFGAMLGAAVAYRWGLCHGEATCSGCGWPARGIHYIKDRNGNELLTLRNVFLPYHPDQVEQSE